MESLLRIPMSYEDYQALPEHPRAEWVDGLVVMSPAGPRRSHQRAARRVANLLELALPGCCVDEAVSIALPRNRERLPDVAVFDHEPPDDVPIRQTPVLVVEVLSPSTASEDLLRKGPEYAEAGIGQFWVVNIDARTVEVQANVDGWWESLVVIDAAHPAADVQVGDHGVVSVDLAAVLH
ncbi:Uma2 family endonuclease [Nocardioides albidus]|uniref:Uma2 family endonuclease n=1 Tax=Nocardioides albidus TaxID=1517589 RepID=UPI0013054510|nr:Uma2 family endonuclease [Nocardioides albidus]